MSDIIFKFLNIKVVRIQYIISVEYLTNSNIFVNSNYIFANLINNNKMKKWMVYRDDIC
jgi:hypothetical protein